MPEVNPTPLPRDQSTFERIIRREASRYLVSRTGSRWWEEDSGALGIPFEALWGRPGLKPKRFHRANGDWHMKAGNNLINLSVAIPEGISAISALYKVGKHAKEFFAGTDQAAAQAGGHHMASAVAKTTGTIAYGASGAAFGKRVAGNKGAVAGLALGVALSPAGRSVAKGAVAKVKAVGPWHLKDYPTRSHQIQPRRAKALRTPYGPKANVQHPGTRGKRTFERAVAKEQNKTAKIVGNRHQEITMTYLEG